MISKQVHLLGASGMGMAPLGQYLSDAGYDIYGWDDHVDPKRLESLKKFMKWSDKVPEGALCIYSSAIDKYHPILQKAQRHCQCLRRGEFIAKLLENKPLIVVCGSHGKSTTTAYLIHFFKRHNIPLNYILGTEFQRDAYAPGEYHKTASMNLIELDESDKTINLFNPTFSVILNTDWDHPIQYPRASEYKKVFKDLASRTHNLVFTHEPNLCDIKKLHKIQEETNNKLDSDKRIAIEVFKTLTEEPITSLDINTFPGIKRRQEVLLKTNRLEIISDYAHHPSEIETLWKFLETKQGIKYVAFEPHRVSRLNYFYNDFIRVLKPIKNLFLSPVYKAFEHEQTPYKTLETELTHAQPLQKLVPLNFIEQKDPITIVFVGAGDIDKYAHQWVASWIQSIKRFFEEKQITLKENYNLQKCSLMQTGGSALFMGYPKNEKQLQDLLVTCSQVGLEVYPIGSGSNLLTPDERYDGLVLQLKGFHWTTCKALDQFSYQVGAGCSLQHFLSEMENNGIGGFEFLDGIPGTLGGALSMNAGTGTQGILDFVSSITFYDKKGSIHTLNQENLKYTYRSCESLENTIIISAILKGKPSSHNEIHSKRLILKEKRAETQPVGKCLGCFFKNTLAEPSGKVLDRLGLKNSKRGDIIVSSKHANFIINAGKGTCSDVIELARFLKDQAYNRAGVILEPEVRLLGKKWKNIL